MAAVIKMIKIPIRVPYTFENRGRYSTDNEYLATRLKIRIYMVIRPSRCIIGMREQLTTIPKILEFRILYGHFVSDPCCV